MLRSFGLVLAVLFGLTSAGCALAGRAEREPLRVLVYNIHAGKDIEGAHSLARVAELVRRSGADLVLLQEVDRGTERSGREDQLRELERRLGYHGAFGKTLDYQGGEYGIAVLSRWPVDRAALYPLPVQPQQQRAGGSYEPRGALLARIAAPRGVIHLISTHLDASAEDHYRVQEVRRVRALADSVRAEGLVLVGGDFNALPGSAVVGEMTTAGWQDAWAACGEGEGLTYPADAPRKRIDYLFIPRTLACASAGVVNTRASDHRPAFFLLSFPEKNR